MVQVQWLQLKIKILLVYNIKIVILDGGVEWTFVGGDKIVVGGVYWGGGAIFPYGGSEQIFG